MAQERRTAIPSARSRTRTRTRTPLPPAADMTIMRSAQSMSMSMNTGTSTSTSMGKQPTTNPGMASTTTTLPHRMVITMEALVTSRYASPWSAQGYWAWSLHWNCLLGWRPAAVLYSLTASITWQMSQPQLRSQQHFS